MSEGRNREVDIKATHAVQGDRVGDNLNRPCTKASDSPVHAKQQQYVTSDKVVLSQTLVDFPVLRKALVDPTATADFIDQS